VQAQGPAPTSPDSPTADTVGQLDASSDPPSAASGALLREFRGRLRSLQAIASVVNSDLDLSRILQTIVEAVCRHTIWSLAGIMAIDDDSGYSVLMARHDPDLEPPDAGPQRWALVGSPSGRVVREGRPIVILNAQERDDFPGYREDARARGYHTVVVLPLSAVDPGGRPMALSVESKERIDVAEDELSFLGAVAHQASIAVRNARLLQAERDRAARLQRSLGTHAELMRRSLDEASLGGLIRAVESTLNKPLTVIDATSNIIAAGRSPNAALLSDAEWSDFVTRRAGRRLLELIPPMGADALHECVVDFRPFGLDLTSPAVTAPIVVDGRRIGGMIVFAGPAGFDDLDRLLASEARFALSVQMMRGYISFQVESDFQADLLRRLFAGDWRDPEELLARAGYLGITLSQPAVLLVIAAPTEEHPLERPTGVEDRAYLHRRLARLAELARPGSKVAIDGAEFVAFVPAAGPAAGIETLAARLQAEMAQATGVEPLIAISSVCRELRDFPAARRECAQLVKIGRLLGKRGCIRRADVGPYGLLFSAASGESVRDFVRQTLGALERYDANRRANLLETLESFLRAGGRYQPAADALGIHVTTLRYRLDRIASLVGIDLDNPDARFTAELALRLRKLLQEPAAPGPR
jgi:PucR-like helix-turn-helix protein/diguanylate cyclase with GGDEF domain/GAF domain-containing protein